MRSDGSHGPSILIIANPRARGFAKDPSKIDALERLTLQLGRGRAKLAVTERVSDIGGALDAFSKIDLLVLAGGDGAAMAGLSALAPRLRAGMARPRVGLLPFGTVGTAARNSCASGRKDASTFIFALSRRLASIRMSNLIGSARTC